MVCPTAKDSGDGPTVEQQKANGKKLFSQTDNIRSTAMPTEDDTPVQ